MKSFDVKNINQISNRVASKIVTLQNRYFLIGGITDSFVTSQIYQFRLLQQKGQGQPAIQLKQLKFYNNIFKARNSFSACASETHIYIWGGLKIQDNNQKCLSDLIEIDINKMSMRQIPLQTSIEIHSSTLMYNKQQNQLIAYGGTNETSSKQCYLYTIKLNPQSGNNKFNFSLKKIQCPQYEGIIWQHTAHLTNFSFFSGEQGIFITIIGGCKDPFSQYKQVIQIDYRENKITNKCNLDAGLVSHDSVVYKKKLYIFGGVSEGAASANIYILHSGSIIKQKGHCAIGCACCQINGGFLVYGGISGTSINGIKYYTI